MQAIRVRINTNGLRRKISRARGAIPVNAERVLRELADEAVKLVESAPPEVRGKSIAKAISRQLLSIFVPVRLKHARAERWPDLRTIYNARIVRGQSTFDGQSLFYVDRRKEAALFDELVRRALEQRQGGDVYDVRFSRSGNRFRVEIIRRGGPGRVPAVVIAFAQSKMREAAGEVVRRSIAQAGLR